MRRGSRCARADARHSRHFRSAAHVVAFSPFRRMAKLSMPCSSLVAHLLRTFDERIEVRVVSASLEVRSLGCRLLVAVWIVQIRGGADE